MARATQATADPMKTQIRHGRFDVRRNFFTAGVPGTEQWNKVPSEKTRTKKGEPYTPSTARTGTYRTHRTAHNRSKLRPVHFKRGSATDWTLKWIRNRLDPKVDPQQTGP